MAFRKSRFSQLVSKYSPPCSGGLTNGNLVWCMRDLGERTLEPEFIFRRFEIDLSNNTAAMALVKIRYVKLIKSQRTDRDYTAWCDFMSEPFSLSVEEVPGGTSTTIDTLLDSYDLTKCTGAIPADSPVLKGWVISLYLKSGKKSVTNDSIQSIQRRLDELLPKGTQASRAPICHEWALRLTIREYTALTRRRKPLQLPALSRMFASTVCTVSGPISPDHLARFVVSSDFNHFDDFQGPVTNGHVILIRRNATDITAVKQLVSELPDCSRVTASEIDKLYGKYTTLSANDDVSALESLIVSPFSCGAEARVHRKTLRHVHERSCVCGLNGRMHGLQRENHQLVRRVKTKTDRVRLLRKEIVKLRQINSDKQSHKSKLLLQKSSDRLRVQCKKNQNLLDKLRISQSKVAELEERLAETDKSTDGCSVKVNVLPDGTSYSPRYRQAVYECVRCGVPVERVGQVIGSVATQLFDATLQDGNGTDRSVSSATVRNMVNEMRVLAMVQCVDAILGAENVNIGFDATSIDGRHINEIHINVGSRSFLLDVCTLPGGTAQDYCDHFVFAFNAAAEVYCKLHGADLEITVARMKMNVSSTIGDRVATNHKAVGLMEMYLGTELLELNCNLHPLDGIAHAMRKVTKVHETEYNIDTQLFGQEPHLVRLIHCISKLRYKQGTGDPSSFRIFLQEKCYQKMLPRYVGNRFHVLFLLAGNIAFMRDDLLQFLASSFTRTRYHSGVIAGLKDERLFKELVVTGLIGKKLTGPWMTEFYQKREGKRNLEHVPVLKAIVANVADVQSNPERIFDSSFTCVPGVPQPEQPDKVLEFLHGVDYGRRELGLVTLAFSEIHKMLSRQLARYLTGDLSAPTPDMLVKGSNAPAHNMESERTLGVVDQAKRRAPNMTDCFLAGKSAYALNSTVDYLETLECRAHLAALGRATKSVADVRSKSLQQTLSRRLKQKQQKLHNSDKTKLTKAVKSALRDGSMEAFLDQTPHLSEADTDLKEVLRCASDPSWLLGRRGSWIWHENEVDVEYLYKILSQKMKRTGNVNDCHLKIAFWQSNESFDDSDDWQFPHAVFLSDLLTSDAWLAT